VTSALAMMANACYLMLKQKRFHRQETNLFCARALTGAMILYDHIDSNTEMGVFNAKKSSIPVRSIILLLKKANLGILSFLTCLMFFK